MTRRRWLAAVVLVACSDPPSEPRINKVDRAVSGMPVYQRARRELVRPDGTVLYATERELDPRIRVTPMPFVDDEAGAIKRAAGGARVERARARQFLYPYADQLIPSWIVEAYVGDDLVRVVLSADGRELSRESLVADAAFTYTVFADPGGEHRPHDGPLEDATPHPSGTPDSSFPGTIAPSQVTIDGFNTFGDPWLPEGATSTNGNNVDAYSDANAPTGLGDGDFRAAAVGTTFPYAYNHAKGPLEDQSQQMAAVTSLFYVLNWLHDFWYDAGFTEEAGNAQASNYGRGGMEGDVMLAEAQDNALGGSRNNANMATPDDGMSPRMQVYLWRGRDTRTMTLTPSGRMPAIGGAAFGPQNFDVTGAVVLGHDGVGANHRDGCTPLMNDVSGKLVLVDRGNCTYKTKTTHAQAANALGIIIANNVASAGPPTLGDDPNLEDPTIPSVSITIDEGDSLKSDLLAGPVSAHITRAVDPDLEGSLDATLIAHEFGHYLHHRLSVCNNAMCRAMSEGWGDFTSLMLLAEPGDNLRGAFPLSIYTTQSNSPDAGYFGIRRVPYSVDFDINAFMFRHMGAGEPLPAHPLVGMNSNFEIHNAGEIWASALWEVYVALHEAAASGETFTTVRAKMARYVVEGLRLAPEEATPMEVRDAMLAVALANSPADHTVMVAAFARRGFGSCAIPPPKFSIDFKEIVESTIIAGNPQLKKLEVDDGCDDDSVIDTGETATLAISVTNQGHTALTDVSIAVTSQVPGVTVLTPETHVARLETFGVHDLQVQVALDPGIGDMLEGDLSLRISASGACESTTTIPIATRLNVDDVREMSATDTFDALLSYWEPWAIAWRHVRETPLDGYWHGDDLALASDVRLTSPKLHADPDKPLTITFSHRYQFERSDNTSWDGGVLEYSLDDGVTWLDVADLVAPGYTGLLTDTSGNPLGGRPAYAGTSETWPDYETVTLELRNVFADQDFRFRFRIGTDAGTGGQGWDIDDVAFSGIVGTPFPAQIPDNGVCDPKLPIDDPIIAGGGGCCQTNGSPAHGALALGVLGLLARRRKRHASSREHSRPASVIECGGSGIKPPS